METKIPALSRRLSGTDAAFLYLERKEIPLHIASVSVFDGPIPFRKFVANIDAKLHLIPRYMQIASAPPLNIGYPTWEYDRHFNIANHILRARVEPPGGEAELEALAGRILGQVMDRGKPLWDIHVVEGLKSGRGAIVARVHHALADGIAGEELLKLMLDPTPEGSRVRKPRSRRLPPPQEQSLADAVLSGIHSTIDNLISTEAQLIDLGRGLLSGRMQEGLAGLTKLLPELAMSVERLPFNKPCGSERKFCWAEFDFATVRAIKAAAGGTVNDVILTVLTRAIAKYVVLHGETTVKRYLRVVCPVSLRREDQMGALGNRISFMPVALPMDIKSPVKMLQAIAVRTEIMKRARASDLVALMASWLSVAPPPVQALLWRLIPEITLPLPLLNMICTNVAGSPVPLYAAGRRMIASYPHVPTGYDLGVNCAVQTYDGKMFYGLTADARSAPDVGRLRDFLKDAFAELCRAARVKAPAKPRTVRKRTAPKRAPALVAAPPAVEPAAAPEPPAAAPELVMTAAAGT